MITDVRTGVFIQLLESTKITYLTSTDSGHPTWELLHNVVYKILQPAFSQREETPLTFVCKLRWYKDQYRADHGGQFSWVHEPGHKGVGITEMFDGLLFWRVSLKETTWSQPNNIVACLGDSCTLPLDDVSQTMYEDLMMYVGNLAFKFEERWLQRNLRNSYDKAIAECMQSYQDIIDTAERCVARLTEHPFNTSLRQSALK